MIEQRINGISFLTAKWPLSPDKPTIIFIHGSGSSSIFWKFQIESLSDDINVVAIDLPGHGKSSDTGREKITDYAEVVEQFIKDTNIPFPIPCGLSMGGAISLQLLLNGIESYAGGIIINSGAKLKVMPMIFDMIKEDFTGYVNSFDLVAISEKTDKNKLKYVVDDLRSTKPEVVYNDFAACNSFNVMERLSEINIPVLVLTAGEDKLSPAKYGEFMANEMSNAFHTSIKDAGHMSPVEKPEEVNGAILNFINKINV